VCVKKIHLILLIFIIISDIVDYFELLQIFKNNSCILVFLNFIFAQFHFIKIHVNCEWEKRYWVSWAQYHRTDHFSRRPECRWYSQFPALLVFGYLAMKQVYTIRADYFFSDLSLINNMLFYRIRRNIINIYYNFVNLINTYLYFTNYKSKIIAPYLYER